MSIADNGKIKVSLSLYADMAGFKSINEVFDLITRKKLKVKKCMGRDYILIDEKILDIYLSGIESLTTKEYVAKYNMSMSGVNRMIEGHSTRLFFKNKIYIVTYPGGVSKVKLKKEFRENLIPKDSNAEIMFEKQCKLHSVDSKNFKSYIIFMRFVLRNNNLKNMSGQIDFEKFNQLTTEFKFITQKEDSKLFSALDFVLSKSVNNNLYNSINFHFSSIKKTKRLQE